MQCRGNVEASQASAGRRITPAMGTFGHVAACLPQDAGARAILCPAQGDAGCRQLVELELGVGVPVGGRTLNVQQQLVLLPPHRFAAARCLGRAENKLGPEKPEDATGGVLMRENQRDAGADEIGKAEGRRHIVLAAQQAIEPVVLLEPKARLDDIVSFILLRGR